MTDKELIEELGNRLDSLKVTEIYDMANEEENGLKSLFYQSIGNSVLQLRQKVAILKHQW